MAYDKKWGRMSPGHIIFLIDQSHSMYGEKAVKAAEYVQNSIMAIVRWCIHGEDVRDRAFITVIGYGSKDKFVNFIRQGWVSEWVEDVLRAKSTGKNIIPAISDCGSAPMAEAFKLAKICLDEWIGWREQCTQQNPNLSMAAPIVLNITGGDLDDEASARAAAQDILETDTPDGKVLLFNVYMCDEGEGFFGPSDRIDMHGNLEAEFMYDISSLIPDNVLMGVNVEGFKTIRPGARGLVTTDVVILRYFMTYGSLNNEYQYE